jgi:hypothetical protein
MKEALRPLAHRFRFHTRRFRILPSFLIIGTQRAGTTSLFYYLHRHPDVRRPSAGDGSVDWPKELHFFDEKFPRGLDWYRSFFPLSAARRVARLRGRDMVTGEATPYYLFHPAVPERVVATLPDVRLIALLRDPIERAYSHHQLMYRTGREELSFDDAVMAETQRLADAEDHILGGSGETPTAPGHRRHRHHRHHSYLSRGLYAEQLERWFAHFPREQLLVLRAEDFVARPTDVYSEVLEFLGLHPWLPKNFRNRNLGSYAPIEPALRARLEEHFAKPNARLADLLGRDLGWGSGTSSAKSESATGARPPG